MEISGKPSEVWEHLFGEKHSSVSAFDPHLGTVRIKITRGLEALKNLPNIYRVDENGGWINGLYFRIYGKRSLIEIFARLLAQKFGIHPYVEDVFATLVWHYVRTGTFPPRIPESSRVSREEIESMQQIIRTVFKHIPAQTDRGP